MISFGDTLFTRFERIKDRLGDFSGISDTEITEIEARFNVVLPKAYKEYLRIFGKNPGYLFSGHYAHYPTVLNNRDSAEHERTFDAQTPEYERVVFEDSWFFFAQWQGYNFWFFDCAIATDDPEVFLFEPPTKIVSTGQKFTEFLYTEGLFDAGLSVS